MPCKMHKSNYTALVHFISLIAIFLYTFTQGVGAQNTTVRCLQREREALLQFKKGLLDENGVLSSWGSEDHKKECCKWWGVRCSKYTGHVTVLDLHGFLSGKVSPSLLQLRHLGYLDLSYNDFQGQNIPDFIGSLHSLRVLNLNSAMFSGKVPNQLGNLTNLQVLDLNNPYLGGPIPETFQEMEFLQSLNLSSNYFTGGIPKSLGNLSHLTSLALNFNELEEPLPDLLEKLSKRAGKSLQLLRLDGNRLFGSLPDISTQFPFLRKLKASYNHLNGSLPSRFGSLEELDLESNEISGSFPDLTSLGIESGLRVLDLSQNNISGTLPDLTPFPSMEELFLGFNQLRGVLPESIGQLSKLQSLDVRENSFEGVMNESTF
nr:receptor-like protein 12 [Ipomoea batatas]